MEKIKNLIPVNWDLVSNPVNWLTIVLMVLIGGMALALVFNPTKETE